MGRVEAGAFRRELVRARQRRDRDRLAAILVALERRAVMAWAGEDVTPREGDPAPRAAFYAIATQLLAWILDLADRGVFLPWGIRDRGDLHDLEVPLPSIDLAGRVAGDMPALSTAIVRGGALARGWVAAGDLEI